MRGALKYVGAGLHVFVNKVESSSGAISPRYEYLVYQTSIGVMYTVGGLGGDV